MGSKSKKGKQKKTEDKKLKTLVAEAKKTKDMRKMASSDISEKPGNSSTKAVKVSPAKEPKAKQGKDMIKAKEKSSKNSKKKINQSQNRSFERSSDWYGNQPSYSSGGNGSYSGGLQGGYSDRSHDIPQPSWGFGDRDKWGSSSDYGNGRQWSPGFGTQQEQNWHGPQDTDGYDYYGVHNYHKPAGASYQNQNYHGPDSRAHTFGAARRNEAVLENNLNKPKNVDKTAVSGLYNNLKKPKRTQQSIEEIKKKQLKEKKDKAMELVKDLDENSEIADKAAKIKQTLGSLNSLTLTSSFMFSPQRESHDYQQTPSPEPERAAVVPPRVKIDKLMVPDLVLTASDFAEVGTGKSFVDQVDENTDDAEDSGASSRPSILPVFHDDQVVPPPASSTGKSDSAPKPRVAYTPGLVENMWLRKRTLSESSCIPDPPAQKRSRRERINSEDSPGNNVDEAMGQLVAKQRVEKLKGSLLKMNKKSLKELVDNPTSSKSRQMMKALVQEHRSLISNCLNRGRFGRYESCLNRARSGRYESIEGGIQGDISENDLDVLPSHVMVEISDMIKQEVPDIEVLLEIKQEKDLEFGIDLNLKCEVEYGQEEDVVEHDNNAEALQALVVQPRIEESSTSKSNPVTSVLDDATRKAPVAKSKERHSKRQTRRIGGHEVVIGTVSDLVNVQGYNTSATDNRFVEEIDVEVEETVEPNVEQGDSNKMKSWGLIFEQESRLLSDLESADAKLASLAQERSSIMQQLQFLTELKRQMLK